MDFQFNMSKRLSNVLCNSRSWNAREIRALLMRIFPNPLTKQSMENFRDIVARCPFVQPHQDFNLSKEKGLANYHVDSNLLVSVVQFICLT